MTDNYDAMMKSVVAHGEIFYRFLVNSWARGFANEHAPCTQYFDCDLCGTRVFSWDAREEHFKAKHKKEIIAYAKEKGVDLSRKWPK